MNDKIINLDDASFEPTVKRRTVLVDFWAPWCGPCKAIAPVLDKLADELEGRLLIAKLNVDDHSDICAQYGVRAIPTMLLFVDGKVADTLIGMMSLEQLRLKLLKSLAPVTEEPVVVTHHVEVERDTVWGNPTLMQSERALIVKALSELEAATLEKAHLEEWAIRLESIRALLQRFNQR